MKKKLSHPETSTLFSDGKEKTDPIPHSAIIGYVPGDSIEDRLRRMLNADYLRQNPDHGLDDDDDFSEEQPMPLHEFEIRHEAVIAAREALEAAQADLAAEKARYNAEQEKARKEANRANYDASLRTVEELEDGGPISEGNRTQPPVGKKSKTKKTQD